MSSWLWLEPDGVISRLGHPESGGPKSIAWVLVAGARTNWDSSHEQGRRVFHL